ncbi:MAG: MBL fold metallo-hydrolase [Chlorobi bacterium]|nr:MBL fold metallo-hydrolase [Chlorobiota bacterium]
MTEICALASGSNGNCYYIGNDNEAVLIDAGIYYKQLNERLKHAGLDKNKIKAIFISHEHNDHVKGARVISKKLKIPVFYTKKTFKKCYDKNKADNYVFFEPGKEYALNNILIYPFIKPHDAVDPCSFRIETEGKNIGVITDTGEANYILQNEFSKCDAVFLESNYDEEMLKKGPYPDYLKQRVKSSKGHLSNIQAKELTINFASPKLKIIFLSHISAINNSRDIISETFKELSETYTILFTYRQKASTVAIL